jgi:hypothetical protein
MGLAPPRRAASVRDRISQRRNGIVQLLGETRGQIQAERNPENETDKNFHEMTISQILGFVTTHGSRYRRYRSQQRNLRVQNRDNKRSLDNFKFSNPVRQKSTKNFRLSYAVAAPHQFGQMNCRAMAGNNFGWSKIAPTNDF